MVSKIIKHSREAQGASAHGLLLGLDLDGTLEVSNSFPLPHHFNEDDDKSIKGVGEYPRVLFPRLICLTTVVRPFVAKYQASMLRSLKEVQADDSIVGFYQVTTLGSFFNQSLVETQAIHQDRLRHGGVVVVHGEQAVLSSPDRRCFLWQLNFLCRYVASSTWQRVFPRIPIDKSILGCTQKEQLQHRQVRLDQSLQGIFDS